MTVWYHQSTIFGARRSSISRRSALRALLLITLSAALITTLFFSVVSRAAPATNKTIGFQGRLLDTEGNMVPNGYYNVQFKIYEGGAGNAAGNPGGTLKWTETYVNNSSPTGAVQVKNGFLSVNLGSVNPFGTQVDWNSDTLWLSMNVAGSSVSCATFGAGSCAADGEMLPMKRITATPFALNAGALNGKTAENFIQLGQGVQNDATTNTPSVFINKTGSGHLIQLQKAGNDVFTVTNDGDLMLGGATNHAIFINTAPPDTDGKQLAVSGGSGGSGTGTSGGTLSLQGGNAGGTDGNSGSVQIDAGAKTGNGHLGFISIGATNAGAINIGSSSAPIGQDINIGTNNSAGSITNVTVGSGGGADAGTTTIQAKNAVTISTNGTARATFSDTENTVYFGNGVTAAEPNDFTLQGTGSTAVGVDGGSLAIQGGTASAGDANGGNVTLAGGSGSGAGASGLVVIATPTFSTVTNDINCYAGGAPVAASCTVSGSTVNNAAAVIVGFNTANQTATLPDPTLTTAGRVFYVTASSDSENFTLSINNGGTGNLIPMKANATASLLWNGSDWTVSSASNTATPFSVNSSTDNIANVQIGSGKDDGTITLFTVDKAASAPTVTDDALLGSMYYDTTLGKIQCYEADGWGSCSASPDTFVTLIPEYSNTVTNGTGIGTMTSDICSDTLNINDGSSSQPTVCGTNETYNFYNWASSQATAQTKSMYVTYKLPDTFKEFSAGSISLMGRTDGPDANVTYQLYRNSNTADLATCGAETAVSTGAQTTWQTAVSAANLASCGFTAGDSIVFRINLSAANGANAYVSNLGFTHSNK